MPSDYIKDLIDHKQRVAGYMRIAADILLERVVGLGDILPYTLETSEPVTLMFMIDVTCKLKRDKYGAQFQLSPQVNDVVQNTLVYLAQSKDTSPCYWLADCISDLFQRAAVHDNSKFSPEEYNAYDQAFPELQKYAYGSEEFKAALAKIQPALQHHYAVNDHHPEFFKSGISEMHLVQLIEMLCDWLAASERSQTDFERGLEMNKTRFSIDTQLFEVLTNTVKQIAPEKLK
jgi:hypothetical protein